MDLLQERLNHVSWEDVAARLRYPSAKSARLAIVRQAKRLGWAMYFEEGFPAPPVPASGIMKLTKPARRAWVGCCLRQQGATWEDAAIRAGYSSTAAARAAIVRHAGLRGWDLPMQRDPRKAPMAGSKGAAAYRLRAEGLRWRDVAIELRMDKETKSDGTLDPEHLAVPGFLDQRAYGAAKSYALKWGKPWPIPYIYGRKYVPPTSPDVAGTTAGTRPRTKPTQTGAAPSAGATPSPTPTEPEP